MILNSMTEQIGNTPHLRLHRLFPGRHAVWMKLERSNPGGSIKDRIALAMVEEAERSGALAPGGTIVEPTSGNTGIGLALVGAARGYHVVLVMPDSLSVERRRLMSAYGAEFVLTPRAEGMRGAIAKAQEIAAGRPGGWVPMQFDNPANPEIHVRTTSEEIAADFPDGLDYIITGVGTGGHITGVARALKPRWPELKVLAVEPAGSPVLSGGDPGPHPIQGIGAGFIPGVLERELLDGVVTVEKDAAWSWALRSAREEGALVGVSSGASLAATAMTLEEIDARGGAPARVLTFCYDTGDRYLSLEDLFTEV